MSDFATAASAAAAGSTVSGGAAMIAAFPPQDVIAWSLVGGLFALFISRSIPKDTSAAGMIRWALNAAMLVLMSAAGGVVLSALLLALAQGGVALLQPVLAVDRWILTAVISATLFKAAPLALNFWLSRRKGSGDPNV